MVCADDVTPAGVVFFEKKIRPVLVKHCYACHSAAAKSVKGKLRLDSREASRRGGESGPAVVPKNVRESLLIDAIRYDGLEMPPKGKLPAAVVADFVKWIELGAPDPRDGKTPLVKPTVIDFTEARKYWAFQPPRKHQAPAVRKKDWPTSHIDRFVLAKLEAKGLAPAEDADRRTWLRRVTFDLTGLPPTREQIAAFLADDLQGAREKVVDRLLASKQYGEHWGRHWFDVARYADSNGGDINLTFPNAWRYRDWVINAFASDKPFDQFIIEQLAGDLLPFENDEQQAEQLIGSGFLIVGTKMLSERDKEKLRMDVVDEQLDSIGRVFLGMTLGCARCHDHKFDPIPTRDYYALAGILRSTTTVQGIRMGNINVSGWIERPLPMKPAQRQAIDTHKKQLTGITKELAAAKSKLSKTTTNLRSAAKDLPGIVVDDVDATLVGNWKKSVFTPRHVGAGYVHDEKLSKGKKSITFTPELPTAGEYEVRISYTGGNGREKRVPITVRSADGEQKLIVDQTKQPKIGGLFHSLGRFRFAKGTAGSVTIETTNTVDFVIADAAQFLPVALLDAKAKNLKKPDPQADRLKKAVKDLESKLAKLKKAAPPAAPLAMAAADREEPADCRIRIRGEPKNRGDSVARGFLTVTTHDNDPTVNTEQSGRLELAHWIASPQNPLTSRVIVNRIWHHLFGAGIVRSVDNFGLRGERPSHPELLDVLATEFLTEGWSVKKTIRKIVLSRTYRLATSHDERAMGVDPQNRFQWRRNRRHLPAEAIRDAILSAGGSLDFKAGGSSVVGFGEQAVANNANETNGDADIEKIFRRSVYLPIVRNDLPDLLTVFDFADPDVVVGARSVTTVPAQALLMMNSPFVRSQAVRLARRTLKQSSDQRFPFLYETTLGRLPTPAEITLANKYIDNTITKTTDSQTAWTSYCHALLASTEFRFLD
jgi:hypothetical protein